MLIEKEIEAFVRDGFIVKKSLLSAERRQRCLDATWKILAEQNITNDPTTWRNAYSRRGVVKLRDQVAGNRSIDESIIGCPGVLKTINDLMGAGYVDTGVRGVYPTLPIPRRISRPYEPHIENHPCQVVVMVYLTDVTKQNGGLLVWPGSHVTNFIAHDKLFEYAPRQEFLHEFRKVNPQTPVELTGSAGDVIFFHHRLFHSGSNNFGKTIRFGTLNDFLPGNFEEIKADAPDAEAMWDYWSDDVKKVAASLTDLSPLSKPKKDITRHLLITALGLARRIKGVYANEYEEKTAKDAANSSDP